VLLFEVMFRAVMFFGLWPSMERTMHGRIVWKDNDMDDKKHGMVNEHMMVYTATMLSTWHEKETWERKGKVLYSSRHGCSAALPLMTLAP